MESVSRRCKSLAWRSDDHSYRLGLVALILWPLPCNRFQGKQILYHTLPTVHAFFPQFRLRLSSSLPGHQTFSGASLFQFSGPAHKSQLMWLCSLIEHGNAKCSPHTCNLSILVSRSSARR